MTGARPAASQFAWASRRPLWLRKPKRGSRFHRRFSPPRFHFRGNRPSFPRPLHDSPEISRTTFEIQERYSEENAARSGWRFGATRSVRARGCANEHARHAHADAGETNRQKEGRAKEENECQEAREKACPNS